MNGFVEPLQVGVVGEVTASENSKFAVGDLVDGNLVNLSEYLIVPGGEGIEKIDTKGLPPSYVHGVYGAERNPHRYRIIFGTTQYCSQSRKERRSFPELC